MRATLAKLALTFITTLLAFSATATAVPKTSVGGQGYDLSYPQCGKTISYKPSFVVVGLNGGLANTTNPCLTSQLAWASRASGQTNQAKVQLYVNTADPGGIGTSSWPNNNTDPNGATTANPYGSCDGSNSPACAYQYGWNRAVEDVFQRLPGAASAAGLSTRPGDYVWWLDVETINTWQSDNQKNSADLEGMVDYFSSVGATAGLYSTTAQWSQIAGSPSATSSLNGLINWRPGARNLSSAKTNCGLIPLTPGGRVVMTQYLSGGQDFNYSCIN